MFKKLSLRTKIFLFGAIIMMLIQGLNTILEIGFLYRNLESSAINHYLLGENRMKQKLERSMIFGKPLAQLNYHRLLSGMLQKEMDHVFVIDTQGKILYSATDIRHRNFSIHEEEYVGRIDNDYLISVPLFKKNVFVGSIVTKVSVQSIYQQLKPLIKALIIQSLVIIGICLPLLFIALTLLIERPFNRFVDGLITAFRKRDTGELRKAGIELEPIIDVERRLSGLEG